MKKLAECDLYIYEERLGAALHEWHVALCCGNLDGCQELCEGACQGLCEGCSEFDEEAFFAKYMEGLRGL